MGNPFPNENCQQVQSDGAKITNKDNPYFISDRLSFAPELHKNTDGPKKFETSVFRPKYITHLKAVKSTTAILESNVGWVDE